MDGWNAGQWEGREEVHGSESTPELLGLRHSHNKEKTANTEKDGSRRRLLASMLQMKTHWKYERGFKHFCFASRKVRLSSELRSYLTVNLDKLPNLPMTQFPHLENGNMKTTCLQEPLWGSIKSSMGSALPYGEHSGNAGCYCVGWCGFIIVWDLSSFSMCYISHPKHLSPLSHSPL